MRQKELKQYEGKIVSFDYANSESGIGLVHRGTGYRIDKSYEGIKLIPLDREYIQNMYVPENLSSYGEEVKVLLALEKRKTEITVQITHNIPILLATKRSKKGKPIEYPLKKNP